MGDLAAPMPTSTPGVTIEASSIGYQGSFWDTDVDLALMRHRWHSPELARWLTRDPAGYVDGMSLYLYVRNNPLIYYDPFGLFLRQYENRDFRYMVIQGAVYRYWDVYRTGSFGIGESQYYETRRVRDDTAIASDIDEHGQLKPHQLNNDATLLRQTYQNLEQAAGNELSNEAVGLTVSAGIAPVGKIAGKAGGKVVSAAGKGTKSAASAVMSVAQANAFRKEARKLLKHAGKLGEGEVAHHVVALKAEGAASSRQILDKYGISLNDPANLVGLPKGYHQSLHNINYYLTLEQSLGKVTSADEV